MPVIRARYNRNSWPLCLCTKCNRANYVEPHGTTAKCQCSTEWTEHESIPYKFDAGLHGVNVSAARAARKAVRPC